MSVERKVLDYEPALGCHQARNGLAVYYEVQPKMCESGVSVTLEWDESEKLWLAKVYGQFLEGYELGQQVFLPLESGPYLLNNTATLKLLEAYRLSPEKVKPETVSRIPPAALTSYSIVDI